MVQSNSVKQRDDYDTFISYSRRNKEFVIQLCEALIQANLKIWVDWNDIPPAEDWRQEIYRGDVLSIGSGNAIIIGLIAATIVGGQACIQHFTLRLILYRNGCIPWNYARFLDYASDRIFLQKVGGGYIFIHRLLLEHFAQMELWN
ncbi:MAG: TIR domain-containing protein [Symploca sp. SIO2C1]|nr:TIR domain-containing protein [Symploca sp. SIO2C1]